MNAPQKQPCSLLVGLVVGTLLFLWLSIWETAAQAQQQQRDCVADLFKEMQNLGIPVNLQKDPQDFKTDRDNAKKAIQNAIKANTLAAGEDTMFNDAVEAIACHLADTPNLPVVQAERQTRLKEAVAKLRNLFQRIANPVAGADDLKDWLAKLFFLRKKNFLKKNNNQYVWNLVRLELVLNNAGAAQEPNVFAVPAGGTDVDLVLFAPLKIYSSSWQCADLGGVQICDYDFQNGLYFVQTKDVANANDVLFSRQGGQQVAGGEGTLQHYTEIVAKHISVNAANWRNSYGAGVVSCIIGLPRVPRPRKCIGPNVPPDLPKTELIIGILFRSANVANADTVKREITGLGLPAGAGLNRAQRAIREALNKEVKGLAIGWKVIQQQREQIAYSCAATFRDTDVPVFGRLVDWGPCSFIAGNNPLRFFATGDAAELACEAFGIAEPKCNKQEK
jgi:hypothetical protein